LLQVLLAAEAYETAARILIEYLHAIRTGHAAHLFGLEVLSLFDKDPPSDSDGIYKMQLLEQSTALLFRVHVHVDC